MKSFIVLSVLVAIAVAAPPLTPEELKMLESFDYKALFANDEQRNFMFDCMLGKNDCGDLKQLADLSLRSLQSKCAECSPQQKELYDKVVKRLHDDYESFYNELIKKAEAKKN